MIGFLRSVRSKISSIFNSVKETVVQTVTAIQYISSMIPYNMIFNGAGQYLSGFFRIASPSALQPLSESRRTRILLKQSAISNLISYLTIVMFYEAAVKPLLKEGLTYAEMEDTNIETTLFVLINFHIKCIWAHQTIDKIADKMSQVKVLTEEYPNNENFPPCSHSPSQALIIRDDFASIFYNMTNVAIAHVAQVMLGDYLSFPIRALAYGQQIIEPKICAIGVCTIDRYVILSRNFLYVAGIGSSYLMTVNLLTRGLGFLTDISEDKIDTPISNFVFPFFLISAMTMQHALPGHGRGLDVFYHGRVLTESVTQSLTDMISYLLVRCQPGYFLKLSSKRPSSRSIGSNQLYVYLFNGSLEYAAKTHRQVQRFKFDEEALGTYSDEIKIALDDKSKLSKQAFAKIYEISSTKGFTYPTNPLTVARRILSFPPIHLLKKICLDKNLRTIRATVTRPSINRCLELYETEVNEFLDWLKFVISLRNMPLVTPISKVAYHYLPDFLMPQHGKLILKSMFDQRVPELVDYINDLIFNSRLSLCPIQINIIRHSHQALTKYIIENYIEPVREIEWIKDDWEDIEQDVAEETKSLEEAREIEIANGDEMQIAKQSLHSSSAIHPNQIDNPFCFFMVQSRACEQPTRNTQNNSSSQRPRPNRGLDYL